MSGVICIVCDEWVTDQVYIEHVFTRHLKPEFYCKECGICNLDVRDSFWHSCLHGPTCREPVVFFPFMVTVKPRSAMFTIYRAYLKMIGLSTDPDKELGKYLLATPDYSTTIALNVEKTQGTSKFAEYMPLNI